MKDRNKKKLIKIIRNINVRFSTWITIFLSESVSRLSLTSHVCSVGLCWLDAVWLFFVFRWFSNGATMAVCRCARRFFFFQVYVWCYWVKLFHKHSHTQKMLASTMMIPISRSVDFFHFFDCQSAKHRSRRPIKMIWKVLRMRCNREPFDSNLIIILWSWCAHRRTHAVRATAWSLATIWINSM